MDISISRRHFVQAAGAAGVVVGMATISGGVSACKSDTGVTTQNKEEVIIAMPKSSEPEQGFNPVYAWGDGEHVHEPLIQSTLIRTTPDLTFENDLATSYESSADALMWTFKIRKDVVFTDGSALSAQDVVFTFEQIKANEASEVDLSMLESVSAPTADTVVFKLTRPFNALLYILANIGIVSKAAYSDKYGEAPIGSGRYMLEQWDRGQQAILVANPKYYGLEPKIKRLVVVFMDADAALGAVKAGKVDVAFTDATYAKREIKGYDLINCKSVDSRGISLPIVAPGAWRKDDGKKLPAGNAVTQHKELRQALNYAVDRQALIDKVLNGYGTVAYSVGDGMPWSSPAMKVERNVYKAQKLMEDAGWKKGADGIFEKLGQRASFEVLYSTSDDVRQGLAVEFSNQMKEVGIEVIAKGMAWEDIRPHEYETPIVWGWGSNAPLELYYINYTDKWGNFASYSSKTSNRYMDEALAAKTLEESFSLWQKSQWDGTQGVAPEGEATWVWFANIDHLYFVRSGLDIARQKLHPHGHGWSVVNNIDTWQWR